jgi:hypothetical protein
MTHRKNLAHTRFFFFSSPVVHVSKSSKAREGAGNKIANFTFFGEKWPISSQRVGVRDKAGKPGSIIGSVLGAGSLRCQVVSALCMISVAPLWMAEVVEAVQYNRATPLSNILWQGTSAAAKMSFCSKRTSASDLISAAYSSMACKNSRVI